MRGPGPLQGHPSFWSFGMMRPREAPKGPDICLCTYDQRIIVLITGPGSVVCVHGPWRRRHRVKGLRGARRNGSHA